MNDGEGVWLRLLDDHILTPAKFYSLSAEDCQKRVQFVPVPYDNKYIGERFSSCKALVKRNSKMSHSISA